MEWFRRSKENIHKYGDAECPNYKVGSMVFECIGRKSAGIELYFKAPNEGMEEIGKLENDADVLVMTGLISEKNSYVEVFVVLISTEPIGIEGLPIGNTQTAPPSSPIVVISVNEDSEADENWHPDSSNDGNSKQDEMLDEEDDDVTSVNRGETEYMTDKWDDSEIEFNNETIAGSEDEKMAVEQEQRHEFSPGASQPTIEVNDSQGGIFGPPPGKRTNAACGVAPKAWQKKKQTVTTRAEILRARSVREKKAT
ncbi:hypothetical protein POM88_039682 [Heracleum sosnowskyi]|uniref:Uncharacterized protein n=1 Tax=Heracleum sosnowskyi TaxID=360622 RepID=A0AAD8HCM6_9APIA|nr:hypothetical protein POM88_039682 [Heracleum sosnowskyi]